MLPPNLTQLLVFNIRKLLLITNRMMTKRFQYNKLYIIPGSNSAVIYIIITYSNKFIQIICIEMVMKVIQFKYLDIPL